MVRYNMPVFGFSATVVNGRRAAVRVAAVLRRPFCRSSPSFDAPRALCEAESAQLRAGP